jgi:ribosomal protein L29
MKIEDIRKFSDDELKTKVFDTKKEYMELRFQHVSAAVE